MLSRIGRLCFVVVMVATLCRAHVVERHRAPIRPAAYLALVAREPGTTLGVGIDVHRAQNVRDPGLVSAGWWYNWSCDASAFPNGIPMSFSGRACTLKGDPRRVLVFNECSQWTQCNVPDPYEAARRWRDAEAAFLDRDLIGPNDLDLEWTRQMFGAYRTLYGQAPRLSELGVHWYYRPAPGVPYAYESAWGDFEAFVGDALALARELGVPLAVTELSLYPCWGGMADSERFMREAVVLMRERGVRRVAWFALAYRGDEQGIRLPAECNSSLLDEAGQRTELGQVFAGLASRGEE